MFVLVLMALVVVATAVGTSFDIIDLPMAFDQSIYSEEAGDITEF